MYTVSDRMPVMQIAKYFGPAMVMDYDQEKNLVLLKVNEINGDFKTWSKSAIPYYYKYTYGTEVLAAGEDINELYVIGVLNLSSENTDENKNNSYSMHKNRESEIIRVKSKSGELIFEYDEKKRRCLVNVNSGDIEFVSNGNISFSSKENILFKSSQSIEMESRMEMKFFIADLMGKAASSISLRHKKIKLNSTSLNLNSQRADFVVQDLKYLGNNLSATVNHIKLISGKLETIVNDIISRAKNVYSTVEQLTQLKTNRLRTLIKSTLYIKAKNSYLKSEEDFKINGDKIHLG